MNRVPTAIRRMVSRGWPHPEEAAGRRVAPAGSGGHARGLRIRAWAGWATLALLAGACAGAGGSESTASSADRPTTSVPAASTPSQSPAPTSPTDGRRPRVLFAGDSVMEEVHAGTSAALGPDVETRFLLSPRLVRDDAQELIWRTVLEDFDPDVVVVLVTDWERLVVGAQKPEDIQDVDAYARELAVPFAELVTATGAQAIWLAAPPVRDDRISSVYAVQNRAYIAAGERVDGAEYLDIGSTLTGGTGVYTDRLPNAFGLVERVRNIDGSHLCAAGSMLVGEQLLARLTPVTGTAPAPGWQDGPWRVEPPFDDPGLCPAL